MEDLMIAAKNLIDDIKERHPNEPLRCPLIIELDRALEEAVLPICKMCEGDGGIYIDGHWACDCYNCKGTGKYHDPA